LRKAPKISTLGKRVAGAETCNKTLNCTENPVCGIEERASDKINKKNKYLLNSSFAMKVIIHCMFILLKHFNQAFYLISLIYLL
jgi:hypothetical protein